MKLMRITDELRPAFQERLKDFDSHWTYPYGEDRFRIDHGPDYFAFFDRLGELYAYAWVEDDRIVGTGAAVLRRVPFVAGQPPKKTWYLCDGKVHPDHRGKRLAFRAATSRFLTHYLRAPRAYAVSMNPGDGSENPVVRHALRYRLAPLEVAGILDIFTLDADAMRAHEPLLVEHRGPVSYLSLEQKKDIVMQSTGERMPLIHVQFGPCAERGAAEPLPGHTHMFPALRDGELSRAMIDAGIRPSADASLLAHRMKRCDWRFVLTSDI